MATKSEIRQQREAALAQKAIVDAELAALDLEGHAEALLTSMYGKAITTLGFTAEEANLLISSLRSLAK